MEDNIIQRIYVDYICSEDRDKKLIAQYEERKWSVAKYSESFQRELIEAKQAKFKDVMDRYLDLLPLETEQSFVDGFRMGAKLMNEIYEG